MTDVVRIIARRTPWPSLQDKPNRAGLRLRWDALTEDGEVLVEATEYPLPDAAYVLSRRGVDPDTPVTIRHEGVEHDSFKPTPLSLWAARGHKRAEHSAHMADFRTTLRQETAISTPDDTPGTPDACKPALSLLCDMYDVTATLHGGGTVTVRTHRTEPSPASEGIAEAPE